MIVGTIIHIGGLALILVAAAVLLVRMRRLAVTTRALDSASGQGSRLGIITSYASLLAGFGVVRLVLGFPVWAFVVWTVAALIAIGSIWFAARAFAGLPWLPRHRAKRQIASTVGEVLVAAFVGFAFVAPFLLA